MSGAPKYKLFRGKEYVASCKYAHDAAVLISAEVVDRVSYDRSVWIWTEADSASIAAESYDEAAEIMCVRLRKHRIIQARKLGYTDEAIVSELNHNPKEVAAA